MALFEGEEMVPVTTPDGRTITVPKSLSGMVPTQQVPSAPGAPPLNPTGQPTIELPPEYLAPPTSAPEAPPPAGIVEMGEPDVVPVTVMEPEIVQANPKRVDKMRKDKAAYDASPAGKQATAQRAQNEAAGAQVDAITSMTDIEAATQDMVSGALQERNAVLAKAEADRLTAMQKSGEERQAKVTEIEGYRKKIENTKIDRELDHPILASIFAALAGIGQGMQGKPIETLDILYKAIDRKVAAQEADLDRMGRLYNMKKEDIETLKEKRANTLEFHNAMVAAEVNKSIRTIEELTSRSASEAKRAEGKRMIAELQQRSADKMTEATRWGLEYDQRDKHQKAQIGLGYRQLKQSDDHFKANQQLRREEIAADMAKALANTKASGNLEQYKLQLEAAKESREFGVRDMNGEHFLTPAGRKKMEDAARLEAEAMKLESNPEAIAKGAIATDKVRMLRDRAAVIRGEATTFDTIKAHNETEAIAASNIIASGQSTVQLIDEIKQIYDQVGRGTLARDKAQSALKSKFNLLKPNLKEAWQLGAWDKGSAGLVDLIIGSDPSSDWTAGALGTIVQQKMFEDPEAFKGGLDAVVKDLETKAKNKLVGMGVKFGAGENVLQRTAKPSVSESAAKLTSPSGTEIEKSADSAGTVAKIGRAGYQAIVDYDAPSHAQEAGGSASSVKYPGLSRAQEAPFEERLQAYKGGDPHAGEELVAIVAETAAKRPDLAKPLLRNLREHAPNLYTAARASVPKNSDVDKQMAYEENIRVGTGVTPHDMLHATVINSIKDDGTVGDVNGYRELARRAGTGDPIARKALADIARAGGARKARAQADAAALDQMQRVGKGGGTKSFPTGGR